MSKTQILFSLALVASFAAGFSGVVFADSVDCDAAKKEAKSYCDSVFPEEDMNADCIKEVLKDESPECTTTGETE